MAHLRSTVPVRRAAAAALLALSLASCTTGSTTGASDAPAADATAPQSRAPEERLERLDVDGRSVGVPQDWEELAVGGTTLASYAQPGPDGTPVGQLDVITSRVPVGTQADALDASAQADRALQVRGLEQVERETVEAPGASGAFRTESTYELPDGSPARSLEQSTVGEDGTYVLVRYSAGEQDFDHDVARTVLDSVTLDEASGR